jgi:5'-deoxynucleotidase
MAYSFFAMLSRMKNIRRWALMRNTRSENICEHSHEVAVIAHALALITNRHYGGQVNAEKCVMLAVYHDVPEILTGDMPTPVKYYNPAIREAFRQVEASACDKLLGMLPDDLREDYDALICPAEEESEEHLLVKAADKLSALVKCIEETAQGNREFLSARRATEEAIRAMNIPAANEFLETYIPAYELTLDDQ